LRPIAAVANATIVSFVLQLFSPSHVSVHAQVVTGDLQFSVVDSLGDPVPGVNGVVTGPNTPRVRSGVTDGVAFCKILSLAPGKIHVRLSHTAFQQVVSARVIYHLPVVALWRPRLVLDVLQIASQRRLVDIDQVRGVMDPSAGLQPFSTYGQTYRYQPPMSVRLGVEANA
jgi:hypothetical protein